MTNLIKFNDNTPQYSVGELSRAIKRVIEDSFGYVKIKGEISSFKQASSGHCYFSLKDEEALISAVCFRNIANQINFKVEDGLEVFVYGKVTTYEGRSNYQIIVQKIEIAGIGALMQIIEKRRQKLMAEGLFDQKHKKPLPSWPKIIAVITSKTGAVIEDILHRIQDRFPTNIHLYPVAVQGQNAHNEVISAIKYFDSLQEQIPDLIIIARGGGSLEDLMAFNDEDLARAVFACKIPIISAIGHETDTTLIDYVSDFRAPTPTAAAEIATPQLGEIKNIVLNLENRLKQYVKNIIENKEKDLITTTKNLIHPDQIIQQNSERLKNLTDKLKIIGTSCIKDLENKTQTIAAQLTNPQQRLQNHQNKIELLFQNLKNNYNHRMADLENKIIMQAKLIDSYHYKQVLKRGYAIIKDSNNNRIIDSSNKLQKNQNINIEMHDGEIKAIINNNKSPL